MKIAIAGLGRMGEQIARKLVENGHAVVVHNRSPEPIAKLAAHGAIAAYTKQDVIEQFEGSPIVLWIMLPAEIIEQELKAWLRIVPKGSLLIDGGNSDFRQTRKHAEMVTEQGSKFVDVGTSGGVWGYKNGFSMMVGGGEDDFKAIEPALKTLAQPSGAYHRFDQAGAGHFVKMVHNAIEYGMMESLAEGYRVLKEGPYKDLDLAAVGEVWQHGSVVSSWLNQLSQEALAENPELKGIDGKVAESGEARWTLETAKDLGIKLPAIDSSFQVRIDSQRGDVTFATKLLAAMRNKFGGHEINPKD